MNFIEKFESRPNPESGTGPRSFYEIELKSLLSSEQYDRLFKQLPREMKMINEETIHTTRWHMPDTLGDLRLRHSDKTIEVVCKDGDPTKICRKEVRIPLESMEQLESLAQAFELVGMVTDPSWTKDKKEFEYQLGDYTYVVCLQHIHNFAHILEVEFLDKADTTNIHEPNLRSIVSSLGCEPIEPVEFYQRIKEYIASGGMNREVD